MKPYELIVICILLASTSWAAENYDDIPADCTLTGNSLDPLASIVSNCTEILVKDFEVPAGRNLTIEPQDGTTIVFSGRITVGYKEMEGFLIIIRGNNLTVIGAPGHILDCDGARWWDGLGGGGGKLKPRFFRIQRVTNSIFKDLNIKNTPTQCFSINGCENVTLTNITIDDSDGDTQGGHNTDAFDTSASKRVTIMNSRIFNQDDCLAINSGSDHVFINNTCSGTHGISIGSVRNAVVENIFVKNCTVVNSGTGVRIKTVFNTTGIVRNITYEDIILENIRDYGITIRGDYVNNGVTGPPLPGFNISDITLRNIHGTVQRRGTNVIILLADGVASHWTVENIDVHGGGRRPNCTGIPIDSGLKCEDYNGK
ncbi:polygalacturonase-like [Agrilus planipennis]|uniref:endo-polygalacturonase n=1 Tax=Agrilus planipennis TaxID=224129 RepID=A0A7F5QX97_AGRPL|nr:polygalacturonase-like [Agrilus planipennis]